MREALDIIELLFSTTDYVDFNGKFWSFDHKRIQVRPYQEHPQFSRSRACRARTTSSCAASAGTPR